MPTLELGPIGLLPPSAAAQGIFHPKKDSGMDLVEGEHVPTDEAIKKSQKTSDKEKAKKLYPKMA